MTVMGKWGGAEGYAPHAAFTQGAELPSLLCLCATLKGMYSVVLLLMQSPEILTDAHSTCASYCRIRAAVSTYWVKVSITL